MIAQIRTCSEKPPSAAAPSARRSTLTRTCYISKCTEDVSFSKSVTTKASKESWFTSKICALLREQDAAFREESCFQTSQGMHTRGRATSTTLKTHTACGRPFRQNKAASSSSHRDATLPEELNELYAWFKFTEQRACDQSRPFRNCPADDRRRTLMKVRSQKAPGLDNNLCFTLRECAEQLADVFTGVFIAPLSQQMIPGLTPISMKCFEILVMTLRIASHVCWIHYFTKTGATLMLQCCS